MRAAGRRDGAKNAVTQGEGEAAPSGGKRGFSAERSPRSRGNNRGLRVCGRSVEPHIENVSPVRPPGQAELGHSAGRLRAPLSAPAARSATERECRGRSRRRGRPHEHLVPRPSLAHQDIGVRPRRVRREVRALRRNPAIPEGGEPRSVPALPSLPGVRARQFHPQQAAPARAAAPGGPRRRLRPARTRRRRPARAPRPNRRRTQS